MTCIVGKSEGKMDMERFAAPVDQMPVEEEDAS
jgi:hypothetical protein